MGTLRKCWSPDDGVLEEVEREKEEGGVKDIIHHDAVKKEGVIGNILLKAGGQLTKLKKGAKRFPRHARHFTWDLARGGKRR